MKGMIFASKVIAGTAFDLMIDREKLEEAKKEFKEATEGKGYESPLPPKAEIPFELTKMD